MLTDAIVPRLDNGGIALCHFCQRGVYFSKGFMPFLIRRLKLEAFAKWHERNVFAALSTKEGEGQ